MLCGQAQQDPKKGVASEHALNLVIEMVNLNRIIVGQVSDAITGRTGPGARVRWRTANAVLALAAIFRRWLKRRHTRQVLAALDEHQLRDIGVTRAEISKL